MISVTSERFSFISSVFLYMSCLIVGFSKKELDAFQIYISELFFFLLIKQVKLNVLVLLLL